MDGWGLRFILFILDEDGDGDVYTITKFALLADKTRQDQHGDSHGYEKSTVKAFRSDQIRSGEEWAESITK